MTLSTTADLTWGSMRTTSHFRLLSLHRSTTSSSCFAPKKATNSGMRIQILRKLDHSLDLVAMEVPIFVENVYSFACFGRTTVLITARTRSRIQHGRVGCPRASSQKLIVPSFGLFHNLSYKAKCTWGRCNRSGVPFQRLASSPFESKRCIINIVLPSLSVLHVGAFLSRRMPTLNKSQTLHSVQGLLDLLIWRCLPFFNFARCICSCQGTILHNSAFDVHREPVMSFQPRRLQLNISYHLNVQRELQGY